MKKNKIVNKIGILVLAVMLSILSSITVLASEPEEAELGPRQDWYAPRQEDNKK